MNVANFNFYPAYAFPLIASSAIHEIAAETMAPPAMVGSSILSAMALAVQAHYRVKRREGLESPCSLATVTICRSGERKSTVDKKTTKAFRDFEANNLKEYKEKHAQYRSSKTIWETQKGVLIRNFKKAIERSQPLEELKTAIESHERSEPPPPSKVRFLYNDVTSAALLYGLHQNSRSASLNEDEAARFFDGPLSEDASLINKGWDGSDLTVDRRSSESFSVKSPRISLNLMVQPSAFTKYMEKKGEEARGIGFIARWLVCFPPSTIGTRFNNHDTSDPIEQTKFNGRIKELLERQKANGVLANPSMETVLTFSPEAEREWILVANQIEEAIRPGGLFCESSDYASKVAENIARIAGIFHAFAGEEGTQISLSTLRSAVSVARWYADEFVRLFSPPDPLHLLVRDAVLLEEWFIKIVQTRGWDVVEKTFILRFGPNSLRSCNRLDWALDFLMNAQRLIIQKAGKRKTLVLLNNNYFGPKARGIQPIGFPPLL